ncbi:MAG TPA: hypothetical protein VLA34_02580, partial [Candidatus Krumholzibacterium sp.]|nr:hypothetical protein [Candidatus Krumholzibacterium sp.]
MARTIFLLFILAVACAFGAAAEPFEGYYRYPSISGETIVFTAEGDLWKVPVTGGTARRLTTHHGLEYLACISPDGGTIAFSGQYEGPSEVYTIPVDGGVPKRLTWLSGAYVEGWTPDGRIICSTNSYSTLPGTQLVLLDASSGKEEMVPLAQASEGCWTPDGSVLYFTRLPHNGSQTKRYQGGTIQHIWRFRDGDEAEPLTADFTGTSKDPMYWQGRIYFLSDRDGTMNIWSFDEDGSDLRQHTFHKGLDASEPSLDAGRIAYQHIADIRIYDIGSDTDTRVDIRLSSDFDQMREKWVSDPSGYLTTANISSDGSLVVLTARGQVFVAPVEEGRLVRVTRKDGVRHRTATFMPDGESVLYYSDESGEIEFHTAAADGSGGEKTLTSDGEVLRFEGIPSPDGRLVAYTDKNYRLWILDVEKKKSENIDRSGYYNFYDIVWSPDGRYLAYAGRAKNHFSLIHIYDVAGGKVHEVTSDRVDSY